MKLAKLVFLLLSVAGLMGFSAVGAPVAVQNAPASSDVHEIQVTAKKYEFSPNPIRVKKGEHVKLVVTATDHDHGFKLDAFHINQKLKKGVPTVIEFTPDQAGTFPFKCSVFCGFGHGGMKGTVVVEE